ncbi:hypothetical protein PAMA_019443 [Pampus argenteus]
MDAVPPSLPDLHSHCEEKRWSNEDGRRSRHQWGQHQRNSSTSNGMQSGVDESCGRRSREVTDCTHQPTHSPSREETISAELQELQTFREYEQPKNATPPNRIKLWLCPTPNERSEEECSGFDAFVLLSTMDSAGVVRCN